MARHCARCGHLADEYDKFCAACGAELAPLADDSVEAAPQTGVLGLRAATEGDSAPMPAVDPTSVSGLAAGHGVLVVLRGPQEGARFDLDPALGTVTVGRSPDCALFLDDVTVSRKHAVFAREGDQFSVRDVGSLNGTYVNRERIDAIMLANRDEVQIGKFRLVFHQAKG